MSNELMVQNDDLAPIADDFLIAMADQAEKRIDAIIKVKQVALKVTNARDWTDQNGNPYLQVSGSEKIANLFNISWRIEEPKYEEESDGNFGYSIKGIFSLGARTIEVEGTRSSKDPFFNRYEYKKDPATGKEEKTVKHPSTIDKGDVKKTALTNLYGNGITRILGIRNLTWDDLYKYAGITQEMVKGKVSYNQREANGDKPPIQKPQAKQEASKEQSAPGDAIITGVEQVTMKSGEKNGKPWTLYTIHAGEKYTTFSETLAREAKRAHEAGLQVEITYEQSEKGRNLKTLKVIEPGSAA